MNRDIRGVYANEASGIVLVECNDGVEIYQNGRRLSALDILSIRYLRITSHNVLMTSEGVLNNYSVVTSTLTKREHTYISSYDQKNDICILFQRENGIKYVVKYDPVNDKDYWRVPIDKILVISFIKEDVLCIVHNDRNSITLINYLKGEVIRRIDKEEFKVDAGRIIGATNDCFIISSSEGFLLVDLHNFSFSVINIFEQLISMGSNIEDVDPYFFENYNSDVIYSFAGRCFARLNVAEKRLSLLDVNTVSCNSYGVKLRIINHTRKGNLLYFIASDVMKLMRSGYIGVFDLEKERIVYLLDAGLGENRFFPGKGRPAIVGDLMYVYDSENDLLEFRIEG
jgi:hypothetical protein